MRPKGKVNRSLHEKNSLDFFILLSGLWGSDVGGWWGD